MQWCLLVATPAMRLALPATTSTSVRTASPVMYFGAGVADATRTTPMPYRYPPQGRYAEMFPAGRTSWAYPQGRYHYPQNYRQQGLTWTNTMTWNDPINNPYGGQSYHHPQRYEYGRSPHARRWSPYWGHAGGSYDMYSHEYPHFQYPQRYFYPGMGH